MDIIRSIKNNIKALHKYVIIIFSSSGFAASLYYCFFSTAFYREHKAVLYGKLQYYKKLKKISNSSVLLRRNIHRLEKGLIMRNRRNDFGKDYIIETVETYSSYINKHHSIEIVSDELQWAHDVLSEYFSNVKNDVKIDTARGIFEKLPVINNKQKKPYRRDTIDSSCINYEEIFRLSKKRRSVRWYKQEPVPREIIDKAIVVAGLAPSACNRQPYRYLIYDDPDKIRSIATLPGGTSGFSDNFPGIMVIVGDLSSYFSERDRHVIYIDASLSAMGFMYALETMGVSTCAINWPDIKEREIKIENELKLRKDERVVMLISYGYPDPEGLIPFSQKKQLSELRSYNK